MTISRLLAVGGLVAVLLALGAGLHIGSKPLSTATSGAAIPDFSLPRLDNPEHRLESTDLRGRVTLLNVWATWCVGCRQEHEVLVDISRTSTIPMYGLNWRDRRPDALRWLRKLGDPYRASAFDSDGRVGAALGVAGAPETYLLDGEGHIVHRHVGPLTHEVWQQTLSPLLDTLRGRAG